MADFFCADSDELSRATEKAERDLEAARQVAILAVAQAQRSALELRDELENSVAADDVLRPLIARVKEDRLRASEQLREYRSLQWRLEDALDRLGEAKRLAELNDERARLRDFVNQTQLTTGTESLEELELAARAEAARLDVLTQLDRGEPVSALETPRAQGENETDLARRARELLTEDAFGGVWPDR